MYTCRLFRLSERQMVKQAALIRIVRAVAELPLGWLWNRTRV